MTKLLLDARRENCEKNFKRLLVNVVWISRSKGFATTVKYDKAKVFLAYF